jgi:PAS domain S-box-containing protein
MPSDNSESREAERSVEFRELYAALLQGELSADVALAASDQILLSLLDSMTTAVFWKDRESKYLGCNRVFSEFFGFEPGIMLGKSDRDMPWHEADDYSSDWFIDHDQAVIESGEPRFGILERLQRADGEERWVETNKVPLLDINGDVIGVLGTFNDVTDRRLAEEQLQRTLDDLDARVKRRTDDLERANEALRREVEDRIRLQAEERQQREYAETLRDTASAMSSTFDLDAVADQTLAGVERLVSNDLAAIVLMNDGALELIRHRAGFGYLGESDDVDVDAVDCAELSVIEQLAAEQGPVIVDLPGCGLGPARSTIGARMRVADQLVGYLVVESAVPGFFDAHHAERLGAVADLGGAALYNSLLASRMAELAASDERQRLARELHDAVNQTLWTAALTAESLVKDIDDNSPLRHRATRLTQLSRGALAEMRALLLELRPDDLAEVDLDELIEHLLAALECRRQLDVSVALDKVDLPPDAHVAFYRIAQEALGNLAQHANARSLAVRLVAGPTVELLIADDGAGFDPSDPPAGHFGLGNMRDRADAIGATISVDSAPGHGTTVRLRLET